MKLEHVALSITDPEDINHFYQDILGMVKVKGFVLNKSLANDIFGIEKDTEVFLLKNNLVFFEIFIIDSLYIDTFNHICLSFDDRKAIYEKAKKKGYTCIHKQKENSELLFIKDKSGNVFELKDM
jgi:catechol 2,3-dioxygenase-like lactoylglutathione lyase family enzyme